MKNILRYKRAIALILTLVVCFSMNTVTFAAGVSNNESILAHDASDMGDVRNGCELYLLSDDGIMPLSYVNGYASATLDSSHKFVVVICHDTQGIGGMGITITTSCSSGTYNMRVRGFDAYDVNAAFTSKIDRTITTNGTFYWEHLMHNADLHMYGFSFDVPDGVTADVQIWIYG